MEVSVRDNLCLVLIVLISLYVCLVGVKCLAVYCECACVEYVDRSVLQACLNLFELLSSTLSSNVLVELCQLNRTCVECACPVCVKCLSILNCCDGQASIVLPL